MANPESSRPKGGALARPSFVLALAIGGVIAAALALWEPGIRVVDGDTLDHGFWRWRIAGIDAPETGGRAKCESERRAGLAARTYLAKQIAAGALIIPAGGVLSVDRYGRRMARIELNGKDAGSAMIELGLARAYDGGARRPWCP